MESRFAGRGQARACRWRKQKDEYEKGGVESLDWKVKVCVCACVCAWRWIFPCRTHLTGNRYTERHRKLAEINSLWGLTVAMHCCHTHMSLSQGVRRSWPASSSSSSFHLPSSFFLLLLCLVKEKSFLYWDSKTNIRLLSASREKANIHWRTEWLRSFWVWRAKSQPSWCSTAFFPCLFSYSSSSSGYAEILPSESCLCAG